MVKESQGVQKMRSILRKVNLERRRNGKKGGIFLYRR